MEVIRGVVIRGRVVEKDTGKPVRGAGIGYRPLNPAGSGTVHRRIVTPTTS